MIVLWITLAETELSRSSLDRKRCFNLQTQSRPTDPPLFNSLKVDPTVFLTPCELASYAWTEESCHIHTDAPSTAQPPSVPPTHSPPNRRLVTKRELLFVFIACTLAAGLLRTRDTAAVSMAWRETIDTGLYENGRFPEEGERLPPPIITDLDSDGLSGALINLNTGTFGTIPYSNTLLNVAVHLWEPHSVILEWPF